MAGVRLYRQLLNELRLSSPGGRLNKDSLAFKYITNQFQKHQTTDQTLCKAREEMKFLGETYLCYLRSLRKYAEIQTEYKGKVKQKKTQQIISLNNNYSPYIFRANEVSKKRQIWLALSYRMIQNEKYKHSVLNDV